MTEKITPDIDDTSDKEARAIRQVIEATGAGDFTEVVATMGAEAALKLFEEQLKNNTPEGERA